jgi:hypothetical protein
MSDANFTDGLFGRYYYMLNNSEDIPYIQEEEKVVRRMKFSKTSEGLKIVLWVDNRGPLPKVKYYSPVSPEEKSKRGMKPGDIAKDTILFGLNMDCLVYLNAKKLFLTVMNAYLKVCTKSQHKKLLLPFEEGGIFPFNVYQDTPSSNPYCYTDIKPSKLLTGIYIKVIEECPPGHMTCEMGDAFSGHFVYIHRIIVEERGTLKKEDIVQLD